MNKTLLTLAAVAALSAGSLGTLHAQTADQANGVSHPDLLNDTTVTADADAAPAPVVAPVAKAAAVKPRAARLAVQAAAEPDAHAPILDGPGDFSAEQASPDSPRVRDAASAYNPKYDNTDDGVVTRVPYHEGQLAEGTVIRTHLNQAISTSFTQAGSTFSARLVHDVLQDGKVIIPVGSTIEGRVTKVEEKRRVQGRAKLRLRPDFVIMPDGSRLKMQAQVIDTATYTHTKIDGEGTIVSTDNTAKNWEITGSTAGAGAVTGAVFGGGVGAVVGTVVGAGVGGAHYMMAHPVAALPESSTIVFQLTEPMDITPQND